MKTLTVIFLGFATGIALGYYIVLPQENGSSNIQEQLLSGKNTEGTVYKKTGDLESINYDEKFFLLTQLSKFEKDTLKVKYLFNYKLITI